jgi:hypothetical protein
MRSGSQVKANVTGFDSPGYPDGEEFDWDCRPSGTQIAVLLPTRTSNTPEAAWRIVSSGNH